MLYQEDPKKLLNSEYPLQIRQQFLPATIEAYNMVKTVAEDKEWISWIGSKDLLVHMRIYAVQFQISKLVDNGALSDKFRYKIARNVADNCNHLEISSDRSVMTISHVMYEKKVPPRAEFRLNKGISNQIALDLGFEEFSRRATDPFYVLLTHGGDEESLKFVNIGIPDAYVQKWAYRKNLFNEPYTLPQIDSEKIQDTKELMNFKTKIEGAIKKDG